ncbi:hypothetical protein SUGI_0319870 [Cryptomeria japonica]|uniref:short-chain type dehydrogenase/reductase n=1 Tax=Cryptomeria japonica TaxID=3369 RepID=UPI002408C440|nr:short-chain type dehydrogenase/reductase [Cryptomeria japonica]GLJ18114.1 hypothetical protein SUGI_0319870 [Cryptomeria japonica]
MADNSSLEGRVAIVTGASRGIGREIALHLGVKGAHVVVCYHINADKAEEVVAIINNNRGVGRAITCKADVSKASDVGTLFDRAEQIFGGVHIFVNSAGVASSTNTPVAETPEEEWEFIFNVNVTGAFLGCREAAKRVVRGGGGRIIRISSSAVGWLRPGHGAYAASKAAVETMIKILARELRGTKITANCVAPGPVASDTYFAGKSEALIERVAKEVPFERLGEVGDVAGVVGLLASDGGEWVNAQVVRANGGAP